MNSNGRIVLLALVLIAALMSAGCGYQYHCSGVTFGPGSTPCGSNGTGGFTSGGTGGGGLGGGAAADFLYYLGSGNQIKGATVSSTGVFSPITASLPALGQNATGADTVIVGDKFWYVPLTASNVASVYVYQIDHTTGSLISVTGSPFATSLPLIDSIAADPKGRFLYVGDTSTSQIAAFQISATTGALTTAPGSPFSFAGQPFGMAVDGLGLYLYSAPGMYGFDIDQATGVITPMSGSPFAITGTRVRSEPTGKYMLTVGNQFPSGPLNNIYVVPIEAGTGALLSETGFPAIHDPGILAVHPSGQFLYTFSTDTNHQPTPVEGFQLSSTGTVSALPGSPFTGFPGVFLGKIDQNGTRMFGPGASQNSYVVYDVNTTTGVLTNTTPNLSTITSLFFAVTN